MKEEEEEESTGEPLIEISYCGDGKGGFYNAMTWAIIWAIVQRAQNKEL